MGELVLALQWGTVGEWVGGLATAGGLVFAALEIRATRRDRLAEERRRISETDAHREAMARAVGVNALPVLDQEGNWEVEYEIFNGGSYPIDNVMLVVADPGVDHDPTEQRGTALELVLGTVLPGRPVTGRQPLSFTADPVFAQVTHLAALLFTDTWDQHWARGPGVLRRRLDPPRSC
jgi:hypothetical protein